MARTSKKKPAGQMPDTADKSKRYLAGIYARISVDTDTGKQESIETQIELAKAFIAAHSDLQLVDCYVDIGKSGTNFKRAGFHRLMQDIYQQRINCILVKDLSRFGRNHVETGNYLEKLFPFMGVRFIAITDNFDSMQLSGNQDTLTIHLKNLVNELYAWDISQKVKAGKRAQWESGSFTGGLAPYGYYAKRLGSKKCLCIEKGTSAVVQEIFSRFVSGRTIQEIIAWLYTQRIYPPAEYHRTKQIFCSEGEPLKEWSKGSIQMLLSNPVYIGCLMRGRSGRKADRITNPQELETDSHLLKTDTHEALISKETFFKAAALLSVTHS